MVIAVAVSVAITTVLGCLVVIRYLRKRHANGWKAARSGLHYVCMVNTVEKITNEYHVQSMETGIIDYYLQPFPSTLIILVASTSTNTISSLSHPSTA